MEKSENQQPDLRTITQIVEVQKIVEKLDLEVSSTLIVFDIDMTLTGCTNPATFLFSNEPYRSAFLKKAQSLSKLEIDQLLLFGVRSDEQFLLEPHSVELIKGLQGQGFKVMGFTALLSGDIEGEGNMETWRAKVLDNFAINFRHAFPIQHKTLESFPIHNGNYPLYHQGVLFANGEGNKGSVLVNFLHEMDAHPSTIIMVDDRKDNLIDIAEALEKWNGEVNYIGLEYQTELAKEKSKECSLKQFEQFIDELIEKVKKNTPQQ